MLSENLRSHSLPLNTHHSPPLLVAILHFCFHIKNDHPRSSQASLTLVKNLCRVFRCKFQLHYVFSVYILRETSWHYESQREGDKDLISWFAIVSPSKKNTTQANTQSMSEFSEPRRHHSPTPPPPPPSLLSPPLSTWTANWVIIIVDKEFLKGASTSNCFRYQDGTHLLLSL